MTMQHPDQADGQQLKADAHALLQARRRVYIRRGRRVLLQVMLAGDGTGTADDVQAAIELPPGVDPRCLGSVPGRLAYDRIIRPAGFIRSKRPETHGRWVGMWELADRQAAESWLREHPELLDSGRDDAGGGVVQRSLFDVPQSSTTPAVGPAGVAR
jgi:hypothetical protein